MQNRNIEVTFLVMSALLVFLTFGGRSTYAQDKVPRSPSFTLEIRTIFADGQKIAMVQPVPTDGAETEQTYQVTVPYVENGQSKTKHETRTRKVKTMKDALLPIHPDSYFHDIDGNRWDTESVLKRIPKKGLQVIMMPEGQDNALAPELKELLNGNVFIMRIRKRP